MEEKVSDRYTTAEELARELERGTKTVVITVELYDAIISQLRAADALCAAAKMGLLYMDHAGPLFSDHICGDPNSSCDASCEESAQWARDREIFRKAIADYEEAT